MIDYVYGGKGDELLLNCVYGLNKKRIYNELGARCSDTERALLQRAKFSEIHSTDHPTFEPKHVSIKMINIVRQWYISSLNVTVDGAKQNKIKFFQYAAMS